MMTMENYNINSFIAAITVECGPSLFLTLSTGLTELYTSECSVLAIVLRLKSHLQTQNRTQAQGHGQPATANRIVICDLVTF